jgi:hypothetical protein
LQALGVEAMRASDAQNTAALVDVGGQMENVCEGCHQTFWYPPQKHAFTRDPDAASEFGSWAEMLRPARSLLAGVFTEGNFATNSSVDLK